MFSYILLVPGSLSLSHTHCKCVEQSVPPLLMSNITHIVSPLLTRASTGRVVVEQITAHRLNRHGVHLPGLQRAERHLVLVFQEGSDVQLSALPGQKHLVPVQVALTGGPAHLQAAAVSAVTDVDVLHFTGS